MRADPILSRVLDSPRVQQAIQEIKDDPQAISKYANDAQVDLAWCSQQSSTYISSSVSMWPCQQHYTKMLLVCVLNKFAAARPGMVHDRIQTV